MKATIRIPRESLLDKITTIMSDNTDNVGNHAILFDCLKGDVILRKTNRDTARYITLGNVDLTMDKVTKKAIKNVASQIRQAIMKYNRSSSLVTYSKACSMYGKANVTQETFVREMPNPHWVCAGPMKLYDGNMCNYRYQLAQAGS